MEIEPQISYSTIRDFTSWFNWNPLRFDYFETWPLSCWKVILLVFNHSRSEFHLLSKQCTFELTNLFMVLFLFFTLQSYRIVCIFLSNSFPFSYYLHFSFHYLLLHNKCSTCHQFYYIYNMKRGILILDGNRNYIKLICVCVCFFFPFFP